jgi:lysylphosphatidylglycerol synthetase-like protein (DUF2156 family)
MGLSDGDRESLMEGIRFGLASAVVSAVVLVLSLRPVSKFRVALVASLIAIAAVDSLSDAYALWSASGDFIVAGASMAAKITVCGVLAAMVYNRVHHSAVYVVTMAFVVAQILFTYIAGANMFSTIGLFVAAVVLSFLLNKIVSRVESEERKSKSRTAERV